MEAVVFAGAAVNANFDWHISLGLPDEPATDDGKPIDFNILRKRIIKGGRDSELIRQCLIHAAYEGWSGEDTYVLLAYTALVELEKLFRRQQKIDLMDRGIK